MGNLEIVTIAPFLACFDIVNAIKFLTQMAQSAFFSASIVQWLACLPPGRLVVVSNLIRYQRLFRFLAIT